MSNDRKDPREAKTAAGDATSQPSQRRRRLVKGALSAPVFLTLQNGSVFANTSNDAKIAQTLDDKGDDARCVFSNPTDPGFEGAKVDFGEAPLCYDEYVLQTSGQGADGNPVPVENPLLCDAGGMNGGYIVASSSHASICPKTQIG